MRTFLLGVTVLLCVVSAVKAQSDFRVPPYVQNPTLDGMTIRWFSNENVSGEVVIGDSSGPIDTVVTEPVLAPELEYPAWQIGSGEIVPDPPYRHSARFEGLIGNKEHWYRVRQGSSVFESKFRTAPGIRNSIRFMVYGDSETEPNPTKPFAVWADPSDPESGREYPIDQRTGYAENLAIIRDRNPDFVAIAGDLVQAGGEQRDWDEFWRQNTNATDSDSSLAGRIPIVPVPGNHEYYSSPHQFSGDSPKRYRQPWSEMAMDRYTTYFEVPGNGSTQAEGRYFRFDYGPISLIAIDVSNNGPNRGADDTNFSLLGDADSDGGMAPSFGPGTEQYRWVEENLADARLERPFVFVLLHYTPYSVGPHGWPAGDGEGEDSLSGVPVRQLTPLFMKYGVDAVFAGHDEMWERSVVDGVEIRPDGSSRPHTIQFYDVGTGGDDLRGPVTGLTNPYQRFLVHDDVPEQWQDGVLVDGGKHYGHLEIDIQQVKRDVWEAVLTPVYAFPLFEDGRFVRSERRTYDDVIIMTANDNLTTLSVEPETPRRLGISLSTTYPNPTRGPVTITLDSRTSEAVEVAVFDILGRKARTVFQGTAHRGVRHLEWDGRDDNNLPVETGIYFIRLEAESGSETRAVTVMPK